MLCEDLEKGDVFIPVEGVDKTRRVCLGDAYTSNLENFGILVKDARPIVHLGDFKIGHFPRSWSVIKIGILTEDGIIVKE